jgi:hypothetical protein
MLLSDSTAQTRPDTWMNELLFGAKLGHSELLLTYFCNSVETAGFDTCRGARDLSSWQFSHRASATATHSRAAVCGGASGGTRRQVVEVDSCRYRSSSAAATLSDLNGKISMRQKLVVAIARQESGLSNQSLKSFQAETADIDLAFAVDDLLRKRLSDRRRVFESMA